MQASADESVAGPRSLRDPRSREYAIQTIRSLKRYLESKSIDAKGVERELDEIKRYEHWRVLGFESLDAYLKAEVGTTHDQLRQRLAQDLAADPMVTRLATEEEAKVLRAEGGKKGGRGRKNLHDNVRKVLEGNSASYLVRRLKRDAPEIAAALGRGEYPSARAAGIAAGIIKMPTVLDQMNRLWAKAAPEERRRFLEKVLNEMRQTAA